MKNVQVLIKGAIWNECANAVGAKGQMAYQLARTTFWLIRPTVRMIAQEIERETTRRLGFGD